MGKLIGWTVDYWSFRGGNLLEFGHTGRPIFIVFAALVAAILVDSVDIWSEGIAASPTRKKSSVAGSAEKKSSQKKPGWIFETATKDLGLCKYAFTSDGMKAEYPMFVLFADAHTLEATLGSWETRKSFTFPIAKTQYYLKLMGFSTRSRKDTAFAREFTQTPWVKTRDYMIGDLPATEYERHVLNPPMGRTRVEHQSVAHLNVLPNKLYVFFNNLISADSAEKYSIVVGDKIELTGPKGGWEAFNTKLAKRVFLTKDEISFPKGFQKVDSVSEMLLNESKQMRPEVEQLKDRFNRYNVPPASKMQ